MGQVQSPVGLSIMMQDVENKYFATAATDPVYIKLELSFLICFFFHPGF